MKKGILTIASILILISAGVAYASKSESPDNMVLEENAATNEEANSESETHQSDVESFEEYTTLTNQIDVDNLHTEVVKDNQYKRIMLISDENGKDQFKSIYVKKQNRLKIVDSGDGLVFNQLLDNKGHKDSSNEENTDGEQASASSDVEDFEEYSKLADHVDIDDLHVKVVEDNPHKRVILFNDDNQKPQYKSIYVKDANKLKIVDLHGGLVYTGTI